MGRGEEGRGGGGENLLISVGIKLSSIRVAEGGGFISRVAHTR